MTTSFYNYFYRPFIMLYCDWSNYKLDVIVAGESSVKTSHLGAVRTGPSQVETWRGVEIIQNTSHSPHLSFHLRKNYSRAAEIKHKSPSQLAQTLGAASRWSYQPARWARAGPLSTSFLDLSAKEGRAIGWVLRSHFLMSSS